MIDEEKDYFDSEDLKELLKEYESCIKSGQEVYMDADDLTDIADYYNVNTEPETSPIEIAKALELHPNSNSPFIFKARDAISNDNLSLAKNFESMITDKEDVEYKYLHGEILIREGNLKEANAYFTECLSKVDDDDYEDFIVDIADIYNECGEYIEAVSWLFKSKSVDETVNKELAAEIYFNSENYKKSDELYNELIDEDPFSNKYWTSLASSQFMRDKFNDAITSSEYAIAIDTKDADAILIKANSLFHLENYEEALKFYRRYSEVNPDDEMGYFFQGVSLVNLNRQQEAVICLKKAEKLSNENTESQLRIFQELAFSLSPLGHYKEALSYLDKALSLEDCDRSEIYVLRGHILLENKKGAEAMKAYDKALKESKDRNFTICRISISIFDNGYLDKAYTMFESLFKLVDKDWNQGYSYMALCCKELNKPKEFLKYLKIATETNPDEAKTVLGDLFPDEMEVKDYYNYINNKINKYLK